MRREAHREGGRERERKGAREKDTVEEVEEGLREREWG